jgi:ADP-ribose pyrophosphatase YjhB (NUDIX family)
MYMNREHSMKLEITCPSCGTVVSNYRNPFPTTDIIIEYEDGILLIKRKNPPEGWAIPGGFIDYGERAEQAAIREAEEETSLKVVDLRLLGVYSAPDRDPRMHTMSVVFIAQVLGGTPEAQDDALEIAVFRKDNLPEPLAFDHAKILADYFARKEHDYGCGKP